MQIRALFLFFSMVSLFACSSAPQLQQQPQVSPDVEIVQKGFSLLLPNKDEWKIVKKDEFKVVLSKKGITNQEQYTIQALVVKLPKFVNDQEFMKFVSKRMKKSQQQSDGKVIEQHAQLIDGLSEKCVKYNSKEQYSGKNKPVILETVNFTCRHSDKDYAGVYLAYSKKYFQGYDDKNFAEKAETLFNNLELTAL
ncbi:MAG: hypothetical protein OEW99_11055 [Gammaproteobacteria bacterium]|nr:hypothetical protein [Gammaproteobacteria bacterium]MDH5660765.1 hypothetical protein [Gammaproteobacteria bacterium]